MPGVFLNVPATKREVLCLSLLATRVCIARRGHKGFHVYTPIAKPGALDATDLKSKGYRVGAIIQAASIEHAGEDRGAGLRVEMILPNGVVVARTLTTGRVLSMNAEHILGRFVISRK